MLGLADPAAGLTNRQIAFANARHTQAVRALKAGQPRHAERLLREAVAAAPDFPGAWADLGVALLSGPPGGDLPVRLAEAKACLRRALRLDP